MFRLPISAPDALSRADLDVFDFDVRYAARSSMAISLAVTPFTVAPEAETVPAFTLLTVAFVTSCSLRTRKSEAVMPLTFAPDALKPFAVN